MGSLCSHEQQSTDTIARDISLHLNKARRNIITHTRLSSGKRRRFETHLTTIQEVPESPTLKLADMEIACDGKTCR